jgi:3-hydroxyisobutyrate dehydrogenase
MDSVAFIGLGAMGLPLARQLVGAGYDVVGFDVDAERCRDLGAPAAESPSAAARDADVVITSLPSPQIIESVTFGPGGIAEGIRRGATFIDMSTNAPENARDLAARFAALGVSVLDAPVSGGPKGAEAASLSVMVGGPKEAFERWQPLLSVLGSYVVRFGDAGSGQVAKLCNNLISGVTMVAIAESCALAEREGLDTNLLYELLGNSIADSRVLRLRYPVAGASPDHPASHEYRPLFTLGLLLKDLKLAKGVATEAGLSTPVLNAALARYVEAGESFSELDYSAVYLVVQPRPDDGRGVR